MKNGKPAPSRDRERFPKLRESIGEDPARWLDRDLITPGATRIDTAPDGNHRLVPDRNVSSGITFVQARIDGIDRIAVCRAWKAVERALGRGPDDGPRKQVIARIEKREQQLEAIGDRPDRLEHGPWPDCDCCDGDGLTADDLRERQAADREKVGGMTTGSTSPSGAGDSSRETSLEAFATDGGRDE